MDPVPPSEQNQPAQPPYWAPGPYPSTPAPNTFPFYTQYQLAPRPNPSNAGIIALSILVALALGIGCVAGAYAYLGGSALLSPGGGWKTVASYDDSAIKSGLTFDTPVFSASGPWRFQWSCASDDSTHLFDWFGVSVKDENGRDVDPQAENRTCSSQTNWLSGTVTESQGGNFYLAIDAATKWKITIEAR